jgi:hypothetical protein
MLLDSPPMSNSATVLTSLFERINGGQAGRTGAAIDAYRRAGELGAGTRNWLVAGILGEP